METPEEVQTEQVTQTPAPVPEQTTIPEQTDKSVKTSQDKLREKTGSLDYMGRAAQTGKEGAEKLKDIEVPKWNPISYRMFKNDPELKGKKGLLVANALFKGLEGLLSTKASGRDFDPTTAMSQYNQAERDRYIGNVTDKENAMYEAQKQPVENAISAEAQAGIATEDAALNSYIQDYTAEQDQNRKMDILKQVMGQAGLTKGVDENGNPIYKDWTELKTEDLLKLNQLMQYLSGDTSVMNVLVGQYGPEVIQLVRTFVNWVTGKKDSPTETYTSAIAPEYTLDEVATGVANNDPKAILYKQERIVDLGNGNYYDVSDTSDEALKNLALQITELAKQGKKYDGILDEIERKTKALTGGGWFNSSGKDARKQVETLSDHFINQWRQEQNDNIPPVSDYTPDTNQKIEDQIAQVVKDAKGDKGTSVDIAALRQSIEDGTFAEEVKQNYLDAVNQAEKDINYNYNKRITAEREEAQRKEIEGKVKQLNKSLKNLKVDGITKTNYEKEGSYQQALQEAKVLQDTLKSLNEPLAVVKKLDLYKRLYDIAKMGYDGRFKEEDKSGALADYLTRIGDASFWESNY